MSLRFHLKHKAGWFAAGPEWQRALRLLSDGAFKLFAYLSLEAERASGRLAFHQSDLARALGKSRRSIQSYLEELQAKGVCRILSARNQYTAGILQITSEYWPYLAYSPAEDLACREEAAFVEAGSENFFFLIPVFAPFTLLQIDSSRETGFTPE